MKLHIIIAAALLTLANAAPTLADDHHDNNGQPNGRMMAQHRPMLQRDVHRFHQGQVWHGHHLAYRGGYWGYQRPNNGVFIRITI